jgi:hypothetical protein
MPTVAESWPARYHCQHHSLLSLKLRSKHCKLSMRIAVKDILPSFKALQAAWFSHKHVLNKRYRTLEATTGTDSTPRHNDDDKAKQRGSVVLATAEPWEQHSVTEKTLRRTRLKRCIYALVVLLGIVGLVMGVTLGITNRTNSRTDSQTTAITANDGTTTGTPTAIVTV